MNKKSVFFLITATLSIILIIVIIMSKMVDIKREKYEKSEINTIFKDNLNHFNTLVKYIENDKRGLYAYKNWFGIQIKDEHYEHIQLQRNIVKEFKYVLNKLKFESIQDQTYCVMFNLYDDGYYEQNIIYVKNEDVLNETWFISEDELEKLSNNWYLQDIISPHR